MTGDCHARFYERRRVKFPPPTHHTCKHDAGWTVDRDPDTGTTHWTSPTGHHYQKAPPELPIDHTTELPDPEPPPF